MGKPSKKKVRSNAATVRGRWRQPFLESLKQTGNVTVSAERAGVDRQTIYNTKDKDKAFAAAVGAAQEEAADRIEHALRERAVHGVTNYVTNQGQLVTVPVDADGNVVAPTDPTFVKFVPLVKKEFDTTAAIFLLKGIRPEKYRENHHIIHDGDKLKPADGVDEATELLAELRAFASGNAAKKA